MNILVNSAGTRNKIIQYFKRSLPEGSRVVAADASPYAPALYEADAHYLVPRISSSDYKMKILEICKNEKIDGVLSLIDPELSLLALGAEEFESVGTKVIGSPTEQCRMALDKWSTYDFLTNHGYKTQRTYRECDIFFADVVKGAVRFPVFVKPRHGSASISICKVNDPETLKLLMDRNPGLIIQEYMDCREIGADCYIDMISGECVSIFTREKLVMRAGETDKGVSIKDPELFALIERFVLEAGFRGPVDIDLFERDGIYYISEVNPRFGGGYPHAYECGADHMKLIANNLEGKANPRNIGNYEEGLVMMKYNEISITRKV